VAIVVPHPNASKQGADARGGLPWRAASGQQLLPMVVDSDESTHCAF
jgi:hypothetical protein